MLFDTQTALGIKMHCSVAYWNFIVDEKHPVLAGKEKQIEVVLDSL